MELVRCPGCGQILHSEDTIYQIKTIYGDGQIFWVACCSNSCAHDVWEKFAAIHRQRSHDMEHRLFQKMPLSKMLEEKQAIKISVEETGQNGV